MKDYEKTCNLTRNCTRDDTINCRIKAFHYVIRKIKIQSSINKFFVLPKKNLNFEHSLDMELSLEEDQNKIFKNYVV